MNTEQIGLIFGIPNFVSLFRKVRKRVGLTKEGVPTVTGANDAAKLASLIEGLEKLGLIETE